MPGKFKQIPYNLDIGSKQTIRRSALDDSFEVVEIYSKGESDTQLSNKVDKEVGKGLSTNDYTTTEKNKLDGIEPGAEVNTINSIIAGTNIHIDNTDPLNLIISATGGGSGGGAVDSVNGQTGEVVLDADDISDTTTTKKFTTAGDISKLAGIEAGAEVNNISDTNATDLTDGGDTTLHTHDGRYYTETETDTLLSGKLNTSLKGAVNGLAELDAGGKVPTSQLPSYVDDVLEYANLESFPVTGETGKIYIALDTNYSYRWGGSSYIEIADGKAIWGGISGTLSNQTDLQNALNAKANDNEVVKLTGNQTIAGVKTFSSSPIVPTPTTDMQVATKKYVDDNAGGGGGSQTYEAYIAGELTTGRILKQVVKTTQTLSGVKITCDTLPTGADLQVQVYKNGIASTNSIFTSDNPISITTGQSATNGVYTTTKTTIDNGTLAENDIIYFYITQVGSGVSGTNLSVICY